MFGFHWPAFGAWRRWLEGCRGKRYRPRVYLAESYEMPMKITPSARSSRRKIEDSTQTSTWANVRRARIHDALRLSLSYSVTSNAGGQSCCAVTEGRS